MIPEVIPAAPRSLRLPSLVRTPPRRGAARAAVLTLVAVLIVPACRVDEEEFNRRVFACNVAAPNPGCGTDPDGRRMACFAARQIGATDFCARTCDQASSIQASSMQASSTIDGSVCLATGTSLKTCRPSLARDSAHPLGACDQEELACYRTDLLSDEGVCTTMSPCNVDTDCRDPIRSKCASTFLTSLYPQGASLRRDHLFCLQTGCKSRGTSCSPGETCLQEVIPPSGHPPDICVPNCDSTLHCPPNFLCYQSVTPIAPNVCIPGLLGFTCEGSIDCMVGECRDNMIGYKLCTTKCDTDADCRLFDGVQGKFICIKNSADPANPGYCQTPDAYRGSICEATSDCRKRNPDEICARLDPADPARTCLLPCNSDGRCQERVGINHTCIPTAEKDAPPVCFPGYFGLPCVGDNNCTGDLLCQQVLPEEPKICTRSCTRTADCAASRWIEGEGWCLIEPGKAAGFCVSKLDDHDPCPASDACKSGQCANVGCAMDVSACCQPTGGTP